MDKKLKNERLSFWPFLKGLYCILKVNSIKKEERKK
jgi:hypothetical protein